METAAGYERVQHDRLVSHGAGAIDGRGSCRAAAGRTQLGNLVYLGDGNYGGN